MQSLHKRFLSIAKYKDKYVTDPFEKDMSKVGYGKPQIKIICNHLSDSDTRIDITGNLCVTDCCKIYHFFNLTYEFFL